MQRKLDAEHVWRDIEEHLTPAFSLWPSDRIVVFYLARKMRLAGRSVMLVPARTLSRATLLSRSTVRLALRRLAARGILQILSRSYKGLRIRIKLAHEIPGCITPRLGDGRSIESLDFWTSKHRRSLIHRRDKNRCFYCFRRLYGTSRVLDHVVPRARTGKNSYRNLVACCPTCNMTKRDRPAGDLLRHLYRKGWLTIGELADRFAALKALAQGRLKPQLLKKRAC